MSYLVLARKARPRNFSEVVGQKPVVRTLQNALAQDRVAHAMIFSGVRGVGKTTLARIMAKALNCEDRNGAEPCNRCRSCLEINGGSSVDLVEIDGASNRGIQEIRELKENIRFMPTASRFKIIIIDEVHMLTTEAFNALLKTLEEPPRHVFFMFATTELHKVPVTILSRCQRYELKRIDSRELTEHFSALARSENVEIEPAALALIVREAAGSVRDGLSLLDQVFSYCGSKVTAADLTDILGLVSHRVVADIVSALLAGNLDEALGQLDQIYEFGMDVKRFINDLLAWCRALVICRVSRNPERLVDLPEEQMASLKECAARYLPRHPHAAVSSPAGTAWKRRGIPRNRDLRWKWPLSRPSRCGRWSRSPPCWRGSTRSLPLPGTPPAADSPQRDEPAGQAPRLQIAEPQEAVPQEKKKSEEQLNASASSKMMPAENLRGFRSPLQAALRRAAAGTDAAAQRQSSGTAGTPPGSFEQNRPSALERICGLCP